MSPPSALATEPTAEPRAERTVIRTALDAIALLVLGIALWQLAGTDGGLLLRDFVVVGWILLVGTPIAASELRRLPARVGWVVAAWGVGLLLSLGFALFRTDFVQPTIAYALLPIVGLLTLRLWRRPWGPLALAAIIAVAFIRLWWDGLLIWYGSVLSSEIDDRWLVLSWHNQAAILMGGFALLFAGIALSARRVGLAATAGTAAALGFAAAWLGGSRGALAAVFIGLVALAIVTRLRNPARWVILAIATVAAVLVLNVLPTLGGGAQAQLPIADKDRTAADSSSARLHHMEAALAMFFDRPLTGLGIGAYRLAAPPYSDPNTNLTSHAHNEFAELFGEGGVLLGASALLMLGGVSLAGVAVARGGIGAEVSSGPESIRRPLAIGSLGATAALVVHAFIDFDWLFPILAVLLAMSAAMVYGAGRPAGRGYSWWLLPVGAALLVGLLGAWAELRPQTADSEPVSWNAVADWSRSERLLEQGDFAAAHDTAASGLVWNPGDYLLPTLAAAAAVEGGTADPALLLATLDPDRPSFRAYNAAATSLLRANEVDEAQIVLEEALSIYPSYPGWGMSRLAATDSWVLLIAAGAIEGGCDSAHAVAAEALADDFVGGPNPTIDFTIAAARFCGG